MKKLVWSCNNNLSVIVETKYKMYNIFIENYRIITQDIIGHNSLLQNGTITIFEIFARTCTMFLVNIKKLCIWKKLKFLNSLIKNIIIFCGECNIHKLKTTFLYINYIYAHNMYLLKIPTTKKYWLYCFNLIAPIIVLKIINYASHDFKESIG